jgi:hypothetical protein
VRRAGFWSGFALVLGGLFVLAFTQVTPVFKDSRRTELVSDSTVADPTYVFFSAVLIAAGLVIGAGRGWGPWPGWA